LVGLVLGRRYTAQKRVKGEVLRGLFTSRDLEQVVSILTEGGEVAGSIPAPSHFISFFLLRYTALRLVNNFVYGFQNRKGTGGVVVM
jgi:hypothetical protein